jgi:glyoxylase-like metal-dependent hydrolase (beta-lactamase superfamily II)
MTARDGLEDAELADPPRPSLTYPCGDPPEPGTAREIAPGVKWIRMPLPFALHWINLWLIRDGDGWTIVDTGVPTDEARMHWEKIFETELEGRPVKRVIVTHMHPDHIGLSGWITRKYDCKLWISRLEYVTCRSLAADTGLDAPNDGLAFYKAAGWDQKALDHYKMRFGGFGRSMMRLPDSFRRIVEGEIIRIGDHDWQVHVGSGHSPEHVCLYQPELKLFISGDQVLPRISSNVSVFPTEPDGDPLTDWLNSCEKLKVIPDEVLVLPAHNEPFNGLHARLQHLIDGHERGLARLEKRINEEPRRAVDVFGALFARHIGPDLLNMATGESLAHLNCLMHRGRAKRVFRDGVAFYQPA